MTNNSFQSTTYAAPVGPRAFDISRLRKDTLEHTVKFVQTSRRYLFQRRIGIVHSLLQPCSCAASTRLPLHYVGKHKRKGRIFCEAIVFPSKQHAGPMFEIPYGVALRLKTMHSTRSRNIATTVWKQPGKRHRPVPRSVFPNLVLLAHLQVDTSNIISTFASANGS